MGKCYMLNFVLYKIQFASDAFFAVLDKFDTGENGKVVKDGPFSKKYNSLNIKDVANAVLNSTKFYPETKNGPVVCIYRNMLDTALNKLIEDREVVISEAKAKLDEAWAKRLLEEENKAKAKQQEKEAKKKEKEKLKKEKAEKEKMVASDDSVQ